MTEGSPQTEQCSNCGREAAVADYCPRCGQRFEDRRAPIWRLIQDFAGETLSFESRLFTSLRDLLFRPGVLTSEFLAGKRVSQVPPVRLYFVASVLFFFLFSLNPPDTSTANVYLGDQIVGREQPDPDLDRTIRIAFTNKDSMGEGVASRLDSQQAKLEAMNAQELIDSIYFGVASVLPKVLILFLPMLGLLLKLLFLRSGILYYDHLVFGLHLQTFLFLVLSLSFIAPVPAIFWLIVFVTVVLTYLLVAMKRVYHQSWLLTAVKTSVLIGAYLMVFGLVLGLTLSYVIATI